MIMKNYLGTFAEPQLLASFLVSFLTKTETTLPSMTGSSYMCQHLQALR